jgi:hypothetical protein
MAKKKTAGTENPTPDATTPAAPAAERRRADATTAAAPAAERRRAPKRSAGEAATGSMNSAAAAGAVQALDRAPDMGDAPTTAPGENAAPYAPSYEEIAQAAYQRYLERGGGHGNDFEDWFEAERTLRSRRNGR